MSFDSYFRDELSFLKEQGRHYSELRPHLSNYLHGKHTDPDVERLLEGFAFLTSRLRAKIDDDFPELTHSIINMLWPNFIRPFPSTAIIEFTPIKDIISTKKTIEAGIELSSTLMDNGAKCFFQTCRPVNVFPMDRIGLEVKHSRETTIIQLDFKTHSEIPLSNLNLDEFSFFIGETSYESQNLYLWFHHFLKSIEVVISDDERYSLSINNLESIGWEPDEGILPYPKNVYEGYRLLHEYLAYPDAFQFLKIKNVHLFFKEILTDQFSLVFKFTRPLPGDIRITQNHLKLHCVPAINLFTHDADPIDLNGMQTEYKVFPSNRNPSFYEVFSIDQVIGWDKSQEGRIRGDGRIYTAFESFQHEIERVNNRKALYYRLRAKESRNSDGFDYFVSFVRSDEVSQVGLNETISIQLTCTNRSLPLELGKGDIVTCEQSKEPEFVTISNITEPSAPLHPVLDGTLLWTLISNLSLNYLSLLSKDALKTIIRAYDFRALIDRQAEKISQLRIDEGIVDIQTKPVDRIFKGMAVRGVESCITLNEEAFANEGDLYMFAKILSRFFSLYASINSFHDLVVINQTTNEQYRFNTQIGSQPLI